jgi:cytochrome c oxidase cbb3-type subunit 3
MSSLCRDRIRYFGIGIAALLACGCERERREFHSSPTMPTSAQPMLSNLRPGNARSPEAARAMGAHFERDAFHITQGGRLYRWFNCNGCHANGGGSIGPALMDDAWRYGGTIDAVHASIMDGRPNGMPAWRGKLTDQQAWQLAAFVRALSGNVPRDAAPSRRDAMNATPPLTRIARQVPRNGDASALAPPAP